MEQDTTIFKKNVSFLFLVLSVIFVVCLLLSNILAAKLLSIWTLSISAGILVFPISYIVNDIITEVYGYELAKAIIYIGFFMSISMSAAIFIAIQLPAPDWFNNSQAFATILGSTSRVTLAGILAYLFGSLVNSKVLNQMKYKAGGPFGVRAIVSTILGELTDSCIFVPLAFVGQISNKQLFEMALMQIAIKTLYEVLCLPITTVVIRRVKAFEGL